MGSTFCSGQQRGHRSRPDIRARGRGEPRTPDHDSLVILNTRPSLVRKGVLSDDHLAAEVGQNGRLTALLKAAETPTTSFAVDPALVEELQTMAGGYQILDSEGTTSAGTGQADATRWLEGFERLQSSHDGYRLLYGSPDVAPWCTTARECAQRCSNATS